MCVLCLQSSLLSEHVFKKSKMLIILEGLASSHAQPLQYDALCAACCTWSLGLGFSCPLLADLFRYNLASAAGVSVGKAMIL